MDAPEPLPFHDRFTVMFESHFARLYRYLDRLSGEPELASDIAQEAFVRLFRRGSMPETPEAWLISVALNLFRNAKSSRARRSRLLTVARSEGVLTERERGLLLLRAEGYSYRDMAIALELNEASVGTLLARARHAFRQCYEDLDAP